MLLCETKNILCWQVWTICERRWVNHTGDSHANITQVNYLTLLTLCKVTLPLLALDLPTTLTVTEHGNVSALWSFLHVFALLQADLRCPGKTEPRIVDERGGTGKRQCSSTAKTMNSLQHTHTPLQCEHQWEQSHCINPQCSRAAGLMALESSISNTIVLILVL